MTATIRQARVEDERALCALDEVTWSPDVSPAPPPPPDKVFLGARCGPDDVLVAEIDGRVVGYLSFGHPTELASNAHVLEITGLAVDPAVQRTGVGGRLLAAAVEFATARGARRLRLRVLAPNAAARALYAQSGFVIDAVLPEEFLLDGRYVDDVLMSRELLA